MTQKVGSIEAEYRAIKRTFGMPNGKSDNYKTDVSWVIQFNDGTIATIYNWKNGRNYLGPEGLTKTQIRDWNVGGYDEKALRNVVQALKACVAK